MSGAREVLVVDDDDDVRRVVCLLLHVFRKPVPSYAEFALTLKGILGAQDARGREWSSLLSFAVAHGRGSLQQGQPEGQAPAGLTLLRGSVLPADGGQGL
jgi:hypothetical protein